MRLIHCADLHLESEMKFLSDQAKDRREELLDTYQRMVEYAVENEVDAILISGDLYDFATKIRVSAKKRVAKAILEHPEISFFYLKGNHDMADITDCFDEGVPDNLYLFNDKEWTSYRIGEVVISGIELNDTNNQIFDQNMSLDSKDLNIVMLHGQEANYEGRRIAYDINFNKLKTRYIDYLAMGHIHVFREYDLDDRCRVVYPGCLEGRGYDETGSKGFVEVEIVDGRISYEFVPFAKRTICEVEVSMQASWDMPKLIRKIHDQVKDISRDNMIRLIISGYREMDFELEIPRIHRDVLDEFYHAKIKDKTKPEIHYEIYANDKSLKGEFVKLLEEADLDEEKRAQMASLGIRALRGEEL